MIDDLCVQIPCSYRRSYVRVRECVSVINVRDGGDGGNVDGSGYKFKIFIISITF